MTITTESPRRNGVDTATLFATLDAVKGQNEIAKFQFRASNTWVTGTHSRSTASGFYGAMQEMQHKTRHRARLRPPRGPGRYGQRPDAGRVPAARHRRLPDRRHRQHRGRSRRRADQGHLDRRGRHRPARDPRPVRRIRAQRLRADPGELSRRGRRRRRDPARHRRAVPPPLGRLRRAHQPDPVVIDVVTG